jgi:hypothetical protein
MSSMLGPVTCAKFNSSFIYYIGFFIVLLIGYYFGMRHTNTKKEVEKVEKKAEETKEEFKKKASKSSKKSKKSKK